MECGVFVDHGVRCWILVEECRGLTPGDIFCDIIGGRSDIEGGCSSSFFISRINRYSATVLATCILPSAMCVSPDQAVRFHALALSTGGFISDPALEW